VKRRATLRGEDNDCVWSWQEQSDCRPRHRVERREGGRTEGSGEGLSGDGVRQRTGPARQHRRRRHVNLDYQILDPGTAADGKGTMEVLLVAAKKEKIADYTGVIAQAGRVPVVVDVDAFALQNAYGVNYSPDAGSVVVLLNAGASAININILSGDQSLFTRDISIGGNAYTEAVQKELNLPFDSAEQAKKGHPVEGVTFEDVRPVLHAMTENVLLEIQKTFDFFKATASNDRIDRIMLSGGASRVEGFAESLRERFATEVEQFDPFRQVGCDPKKVGIDSPDDYGAVAAVAMGLALRKVGDR